MHRGYEVIVCTAAGRRRYMRYLIPYILDCNIVDRYDIWVHTHNCADIEFFKRLAAKYSKINLVWQPDGIVGGNETINAFYKQCVADDTIYFKVDDDVIWMEKDAILKMVEFRIDNPDKFLVSPLIVNNPICSYLLQVYGKLPMRQYQMANPLGNVFWKSGEFAEELHNWFLENNFSSNIEKLHVGPCPIGVNRLSINAVMWFGKEMAKFGGVVPGDDEEFLSCIYPTRNGLVNSVNGNCIMVHYAFFTQRTFLDSTDILSRYGCILSSQSASQKTVDGIMKQVDSEEEMLLAMPSPYQRPALPIRKKTLKYYIWKLCPAWLWIKIRPEKYEPYIVPQKY